MTKTIDSFKSEIREILRDPEVTGGTPHYSDDKIRAGVVDGFRRLYAVRPESRYVGGVLTDVEFPEDNTLGSFQVTFEDRWRLGIVYFAVARCFEADVTDTVNMQLAADFKKQADAVFAA